MTDATDLRKQVVRAMSETMILGEHGERRAAHYLPDSETYLLAKSALAIAEPIIRAQVIEELAQIAAAGHPDCLTPCSLDPGDEWQVPLADWLRAQGVSE